MAFTEIEQHQAAGWQPKVLVLGTANEVLNERGI
jgi:aspartate 1-decarboxylase